MKTRKIDNVEDDGSADDDDGGVDNMNIIIINNNNNNKTEKTDDKQVQVDDDDDNVCIPACYTKLTILLLANITNSMDVYLLVGLLSEMQAYFNLSYESLSLTQGFLTGGFILSYPVFLLLEERFSRKWIAVIGMVIKAVTILSSSFVPPNGFVGFLCLRVLSGMGVACQTSVTPKLIQEATHDKTHAMGLTMFYMSIPIGNGLGIIVGTLAGKDNWRMSLRVTPAFTVILCVLIITMLESQKRDASTDLKMIYRTTLLDLKQLLFHQAYLMTTLGFMCSLFVTGAVGFWGLFFLHRCAVVNEINVSAMTNAIIFGLVLATSGISGMAFALWLILKLKRFKGRGGIFISSCAMACSFPVFISFAMANSYYIKWPLLFICFICLYMTRAIIADIMLYVINPSQLSLAWSVQHLICHSWGDALGAFLVGASLDNEVPEMRGKLEDREYLTLQNTFFTTSLGLIIGSIFYFVGGIFYKPVDFINYNQKEHSSLMLNSKKETITPHA